MHQRKTPSNCINSLEGTLLLTINGKYSSETSGSQPLGSYFTTKEATQKSKQLRNNSNKEPQTVGCQRSSRIIWSLEVSSWPKSFGINWWFLPWTVYTQDGSEPLSKYCLFVFKSYHWKLLFFSLFIDFFF